jgi:hypothetical protein
MINVQSLVKSILKLLIFHWWCNGLVNVLASSVVDRGFETPSGKIKNYKIVQKQMYLLLLG